MPALSSFLPLAGEVVLTPSWKNSVAAQSSANITSSPGR